MFVAAVVFTCVAVVALLAAEHRGSHEGVWIAKPLASSGFLAVALAAGALQTSYGRLIFLGLALSWLGDVLLIPRDRAAVFMSGVLAFLLGHVAFAVAFVARGMDLGWAAVVSLGVPVALIVVYRWLAPHVHGPMRNAVLAYMIVISTMLVTAFGTFGAHGGTALLAGAIAFYLSDLSVARDRFVEHAFVNRLWGLPLYFGAQLLLAYSASA